MFATTHWSVVLDAASAETTRAQAALESLCRAYWQPLYAFARRNGSSFHDAQDLVQGFLAVLIERDGFKRLAPDKGRFRSFLLTAFKNYLADQCLGPAAYH